jgi:hypothetical protein
MNTDINNPQLSDSFKYRSVLEKGKPVHDKYDSFSIKHPAMDLSRRAKIFSPFDALKGFNEELFKTETLVTDGFKDETSPSEEIP